MKKPSRDPGNKIKQILRKEVNYGCPVRYPDGTGCGCPILTFHHFDPPWAGKYEHNLDGMVALCPEHHLQADGGLWSKSQLSSFKEKPFVDDILKVQWPWQPETLIMKAGPSLVMGSGSPIRLDKRPVMLFQPKQIDGLDIKTTIFDSDIRSIDGKRWLRIEDSWFDLRLEKTTDVIFTPQTKRMIAKHDDSTYISLQFRKYSFSEFGEWVQSFIDKPDMAKNAPKTAEKVGAVDSDGNISVIAIEGSFTSKKVAIQIRGNRMKFKSLAPGLEEEFEWHSWIVSDKNRAILKMEKGREFFSLG